MPLITAALSLYVFHAITKDLVPGKAAQNASLMLGVGMFNFNNQKSFITRMLHRLQQFMASGYGLPPSPTVVGKYEL
jgi:hypothetical protein